jgi:hypothetical protein
MISNYHIVIHTESELTKALYGDDYKYTHSVGVKFVYNGKMHGSFVKLDHEPTAEDVRCIAETLTNNILNELQNEEKTE